MTQERRFAGFRLSRTRLILLAVYFAVVFPVLMSFNIGLVPDVLAFVFLGAAVVAGQARLFVRDWGVFLLVIVLWQQTSTLATWVGYPLHMYPLINIDRDIMSPFLHGALPQVWLQQHLYHAGTWQWYDVMSWAIYGLHFPEPLVVGLLIWLYDRTLFRRFTIAFLTLAAIAFIIYIVYPAVPPWMASKTYKAIPHVINIFSQFNYAVLQQGLGHHYHTVLHVDYNLTAAMPSLHAAFPLLSALYLRKVFGRWGLLMLVYAAIVWFSVVYMAEHWVIDVLAGLACAVIAYALVEGTARALAAMRARRVVPAVAVRGVDGVALPAAAESRQQTEAGWK